MEYNFCPKCGAQLDSSTGFYCRNCGARLDSFDASVGIVDYHRKSPGIAAICSIICPGLGQVYTTGGFGKGILIFLGTLFGLGFFLLPGIAVYIYGIYDAHKTAHLMNRGKVAYSPTKVGLMIGFVAFAIFFGVIISAVIAAFIFGMAGGQSDLTSTYPAIPTVAPFPTVTLRKIILATPSDFQDYHNNEMGFGVAYPKSWSYQEIDSNSEIDGIRIKGVGFTPILSYGDVFIGIMSYPYEGTILSQYIDQSFLEITDSFIQGYRETKSGFTIFNDTRVYIYGFYGRSIEYQYMAPDGTMIKGNLILTSSEQKFYAMMLECIKTKYSTYYETFRTMSYTFHTI